MLKRPMDRDIFGNPVSSRRPRYEATLERMDKVSLTHRAARMRWLSRVIPKDIGFMMSMETYKVFEEAKSSFITGNFVATIVLSACFIEHWLVVGLSQRGFTKESSKGLASSIKVARDNKLIDKFVLDSADRLRKIRNPFVHLKSFEHEYTLAQRTFKKRVIPDELLEQDAKEALSTMYAIAVYALSRT